MRAKIGQYFLVLVICIASLEAGLYLMIRFGFLDVSYPSYSIANAKPFWRDLNADFGVWHSSNAKYRHWKVCFEVEYQSNSHGMRDAEADIESESRRVVVLGDSFVEGLGIDYGERFTELLESFTGLDHLNFGTSGNFGTTQSFVLYETFASKFSHEAVIFAVLPNNDFLDDQPNFGRLRQGARHRPYLVGKFPNYEIEYPSDDFTPEYKLRKFFGNLLQEFSLTVRVGRYITRYVKYMSAQKKVSVDPGEGKIGSYYFDYSQQQFDRLRFAIGRIKKQAGDKPVLVFTIPRHEDFERASIEKGTPPLTAELEKLSGEIGFNYVDLLIDMKGVPDWKTFFHTCDNHWGPKGHYRAAEILSKWDYYSVKGMRDSDLRD